MTGPKPHLETQLQEEFLAEMRALDAFRVQLSARHPEAQLRRDDPDVRRLMEAMAYFSVRSRQQLLRNMESTWLRLFSDQFEPLLTTLPAVATVQALVNSQRAETAVLPRGTELHLATRDGQRACFRMLDDLRIFPLRIERVLLLSPQEGTHFRIAIELVSGFERRDAVGLLRLHTRLLDDYAASARFLYQLQAHLQQAHVVYDGQLSAEETGQRCSVSYGSDVSPVQGRGSGGPGLGQESLHSLEQSRAFFHFPERELFLNLDVPAPLSRGGWRRLFLYLDLDPDWPVERIAKDNFHLHVVPIQNVRREAAAPIRCDGTLDALPIRHPSPEHGYELRSVLGVYAVRGNALVPLLSSLIPDREYHSEVTASPDDTPSYQMEERLTPLGPVPHLVVRTPAALTEPLLLHVDALWHQPGFAEAVRAEAQLSVAPVTRVLDGIRWELRGGVRAHAESLVRGSLSGLLRVLSMSMRPVMKEADLRWMMQTLVGKSGPAAYRKLPSRIEKLHWRVSPDSALRGSGIRHVYEAQLTIEPGEDEALAWNFLRQVYLLLDAWNQDSTIDLHVATGETKMTLPIFGSPPARGQE